MDVGLGTKTNSGMKDVIKALEDVIDDKEWYNVRFYLHCYLGFAKCLYTCYMATEEVATLSAT